MIAYGYEARGEATDDVAVYAIDRTGRVTWETWIKVPYVGMLHDFAVTQTHIAFLVIPMATDVAQMKRGGVHFAWNPNLPTWLGVMRRGGDGKDLRWFKGPERCATHVMGAFSDGERIYIDMDMGLKNQFPFFPNTDGAPWDRKAAEGHVTRLSVDLSKKHIDSYDMEILFPREIGILPRQDDRFHTLPYRYGFMPTIDVSKPVDERLANAPTRPVNCYTKFDVQTRQTSTFYVGNASSLQECCFVPRSARAPEGDGYLIGLANVLLEGRSNLVVVDTQHMADGAVATVKLPFRLNHGHSRLVGAGDTYKYEGDDLMTPKAAYEVRMIGVLTLMFGFVFFDRNAMGNLAPFITASLHLTNGQIGALSSGLSICWAISGFAIGTLSDALGRRKSILLITVVIFSVCSVFRDLRPPSACCWPRAC